MLDLSGTVHVDDKLLPGVKEAVSILKEQKVPIQYVTNTSKENLTSLGDRVRRAGLDIKDEEIFSSLTAARDLVQTEGLRPLMLLEESAVKQFEGIDCRDPNCVLVGLSPSSFHYEKLNEAFKLGINLTHSKNDANNQVLQFSYERRQVDSCQQIKIFSEGL